MTRSTILIADRHALVRRGIVTLLEAQHTIAGEAANGREAITLAAKVSPAIVILDIVLPRLNGLEAAHEILAKMPATRVLVLSDEATHHQIAHALRVGVSGYMLKSQPADVLPRAVDTLAKGQLYFAPFVAQIIKNLPPFDSHPSGLTRREREITQLIAESLSTKEIGKELGLTESTVNKHRHRLMSKLHLHDVASLVRFAINAGIAHL